MKRIALSIRNNIDGDLDGPYTLPFAPLVNLCAGLEARRPLTEWFSVRSVNQHTSPALNWEVGGHTAAETRAAVNAWGQQVLASWNRDHRLTLTTRPCADEDHEKRKKEGTSQCFRSGQDGAHFSSPLASVAFAESLQTQTRTGFTVEKYNGLSGMSGLSAFLRKTAFKLILISQKCSDTSLCPP